MARKTDRLEPLGDDFGMKTHPQCLKAGDLHHEAFAARLKPCPFKTKSFRNLKCDCPAAGAVAA